LYRSEELCSSTAQVLYVQYCHYTTHRTPRTVLYRTHYSTTAYLEAMQQLLAVTLNQLSFADSMQNPSCNPSLFLHGAIRMALRAAGPHVPHDHRSSRREQQRCHLAL